MSIDPFLAWILLIALVLGVSTVVAAVMFAVKD